MTHSSDNSRDAIQEIRSELLKKLLPELEKAKQLVLDLEEAVARVQGANNEPAAAAVPQKMGHEVAQEYLAACGKPMSLDEVVDAIIQAGVMLGKEKPRTQAQKSIRWAVAAGRLTIKDDMIGLPEWDRGEVEVQK
jgi:hypothetical protein